MNITKEVQRAASRLDGSPSLAPAALAEAMAASNGDANEAIRILNRRGYDPTCAADAVYALVDDLKALGGRSIADRALALSAEKGISLADAQELVLAQAERGDVEAARLSAGARRGAVQVQAYGERDLALAALELSAAKGIPLADAQELVLTNPQDHAAARAAASPPLVPSVSGPASPTPHLMPSPSDLGKKNTVLAQAIVWPPLGDVNLVDAIGTNGDLRIEVTQTGRLDYETTANVRGSVELDANAPTRLDLYKIYRSSKFPNGTILKIARADGAPMAERTMRDFLNVEAEKNRPEMRSIIAGYRALGDNEANILAEIAKNINLTSANGAMIMRLAHEELAETAP